MGKITVREGQLQRHNPLHADISAAGGTFRDQAAQKKNKHRQQQQDDFLDAKTLAKILDLAKQQQDEIEEEENGKPLTFSEKFNPEVEESDEEDEEEYSEFEVDEEVEVDEADTAMFDKYFGNQNGLINLADKILAKIAETEAAKKAETEGVPRQDGVRLPPKVIAAYEKIGLILLLYSHGKLPKLFKVMPSLRNWEDVLYVTNPDNWTVHAVYEATKLFVSNLLANEAQKFVEQVLLHRFRREIEELDDHSLNYHIYRALKKLLYKPAAFFKGFLLPLVDGYATTREATIAASVLSKVSVPVLHSSVALAQLTKRPFRPATTVFIRVLIEKKYALPYQTVDELVFYFMRFRNAAQSQEMQIDGVQSQQSEEIELPVVWHKAFLAFAQRYKNDITDDQRDFLLETVRQRFHPGMGPEIRRELLAGKPRLTGEGEGEVTMADAF